MFCLSLFFLSLTNMTEKPSSSFSFSTLRLAVLRSLPLTDTHSSLYTSSLLSFHHLHIPSVSLSYSFLLTLPHWQPLLSLFLPGSPLFHQSPSMPRLMDTFLFPLSYKESSPHFFFLFQLKNSEFLHIQSINFFTWTHWSLKETSWFCCSCYRETQK